VIERIQEIEFIKKSRDRTEKQSNTVTMLQATHQAPLLKRPSKEQ
jgi:hypothetical protein